jgi:hypothetical protein
MKFEISQKDKNLLVFLSVFVIVVCIGYWGVYPAITSISETENSIEDEENTKEINEYKVSQLPLYETDNAKLEEDILDAKGNYYPIMSNDEVDMYFTELVLNDYNLLSYDLSIGNKELTDLEPYMYSEKAIAQSEAEALAAAGGTVATDETDETAETTQSTDESGTLSAEDATAAAVASMSEDVNAAVGIYSVKVSMKLGGTNEDLMKFIDDMSTSDKKMRVVRYSWSGERSVEYDEDGNYSVDLSRTLEITIEMYMCEE